VSLVWEPKWVRKTLEEYGIRITTCVDENTGLIMCPVCGDIDEFCPPGKTTSRTSEDVGVFFTFYDLVWHIIAHARGEWIKAKKAMRVPVEVEEEEEAEEE